jgi:aspartyl-tRNA(Asn)/glutamyl-tRNA(Gln) amidotransferase subunit A
LVETYEQTRAQGFGDEVTRRILMGTFVLSHGYSDAYYHQALKVRRIIHDEMKAVLQEVDAILTPTTPTTAFKVGEKVNDPLAMYKADIFTVGVNVVGVPALVVPVGKDANGLPVGMQLIADHYDEATLFTLGSALENIVTQ